MYYDIIILFTICRHTYRMHRQCYGSELFRHYSAIKSRPFLKDFQIRVTLTNWYTIDGCNY